MPVIAGAVSPDGQRKLETWRNQETPCCVGRVNGVEVIALRDTGSTTCCAKVLCMDNPVQEVIIGNIPGAVGLRQQAAQ